jgi:outer membrane protein assembly factor BamE
LGYDARADAQAIATDVMLILTQMKKILIVTAILAITLLIGCSRDRIPFVHQIDIQQGNVITQEAVDQLRPGMTKRQVQFVMGTPLLVDVFHQDRWDYVYFRKPGRGEVVQNNISLFFADGSLVRTTGTWRPSDEPGTVITESRQVNVLVPDHERKKQGFFTKVWHWITFRKTQENI